MKEKKGNSQQRLGIWMDLIFSVGRFRASPARYVSLILYSSFEANLKSDLNIMRSAAHKPSIVYQGACCSSARTVNSRRIFTLNLLQCFTPMSTASCVWWSHTRSGWRLSQQRCCSHFSSSSRPVHNSFCIIMCLNYSSVSPIHDLKEKPHSRQFIKAFLCGSSFRLAVAVNIISRRGCLLTDSSVISRKKKKLLITEWEHEAN